jgi:hypothetical protein
MNKELIGSLFVSIHAELKPFGFKLAKSKQRLLRFSEKRMEILQFAVLDDETSYRICPSVGVRFDDVEEIFHRTSGFEPEYQNDTATVGVNLWGDNGGNDYQIPLRGAEEVDAVVSQVSTIFRENALPYFAQFCSLVAVDSAVNDQPTLPCIHRSLPCLRCSTGAIVAKLTGRKNYDELISIYHAVMRVDSNGFYLPDFEALLSDLEGVGMIAV